MSKYFSDTISKMYHIRRHRQGLQKDQGPSGTSANSKNTYSLTACDLPAPKPNDSLVGGLLSSFYKGGF